MSDYKSLTGIVADADLSAYQYHAVKLSATNRKVSAMTDANAERPVGILQNDPDADGKAAEVATSGQCKAKYGGNVTAGNTLICGNTGLLIADVEVKDGTAVDVHHIADAIESGAINEIHEVLLHTPVRIGLE